MEGAFAKIMNSFEMKWQQFIEEKGFEGFMDEYYGRWLHTCVSQLIPHLSSLTGMHRDQEVTLTTTEPHSRLRIKSITSDHGLLRCIPIDSTSTSTASNSDLTPLYNRGDYGDDDRVSTTPKVSKQDRFVDLQPDGNSFDLMSGLIKTKV